MPQLASSFGQGWVLWVRCPLCSSLWPSCSQPRSLHGCMSLDWRICPEMLMLLLSLEHQVQGLWGGHGVQTFLNQKFPWSKPLIFRFANLNLLRRLHWKYWCHVQVQFTPKTYIRVGFRTSQLANWWFLACKNYSIVILRLISFK